MMHYLIVGSSAAGVAAARAIRDADSSGAITMLTKDEVFFSRCQLHLVAAGLRTRRQADFVPAGWAGDDHVEIRWNTTAASLDPRGHVLTTTSGERFSYDRLLIATGSRTWLPPIDGLAGELTFGLRDLADGEQILAALPEVRIVTIIGAGLVGCELAAALIELDKVVNVVELAPHPLPLQLEETTGGMCADMMRRAGILLHCGRKVVGGQRKSNGNPMAVVLDNGERIASDLIVAAAGVRPNIEWLKESGIATEPRGVLIDEHGRTNLSDVYAAGDVTVMEDVLQRVVMPSAIWPTAVHQGRIAGANMSGGNESLYRNTGFRASVHLLQTNIVSLGPAARPDPKWEKVDSAYTNSRGQACRKVMYFEGDILKAAIVWGDVTDAGVYADAIINRRSLPMARTYAACLDGAKFGAQERSLL